MSIVTAESILAAIEPFLEAERKALKSGVEDTWDLPEFATARHLTERAGCVWDFNGWFDTAETIRFHRKLGGVELR